MNFDLSEEQVMLRDAAARFVREQYDFEHRRKLLTTEAGWSRDHWKSYAEFGWLSLGVPEEFGGLGCTFVETSIVLEELGRGMVLEPVLASAVLCTRLLDRSGNDALRGQWLPALATGEAIFALAHEEFADRHALGLPGLKAVGDGATYRLQGAKTLVLGAPAADQLIVSARMATPQGDTLALFIVDAKAPGLGLASYRLVDGRLAADVQLDAVSCPAASLLAQGATAQAVLNEALDHARLAAMAEALGGIEACLEVTSEYVKTRVQFGQPIGKFQSLQHLMAEMFVDAQDARSIVFNALARIDAPAEARSHAVAAAKLFVGEAGRRVSAKGVQMHGGYGTVEEYRISHHFRQLFVLEKLFGDAQASLQTLGRNLS